MSPSAVEDPIGATLPEVLLLGEIDHARPEWEELRSIAILREVTKGSREQFLQDCKTGVYDRVVAVSRTVPSADVTGRFDEELVQRLPPRLKFVAHNGAGYDQIDADACARRGIAVSNTPGVVDAATADVAAFLMLGALRRAYDSEAALRSGKFRSRLQLGHDPQGKTVGVLGMGGIGTAFAHRAAAFGMRVQYHNRRPVPVEGGDDENENNGKESDAHVNGSGNSLRHHAQQQRRRPKPPTGAKYVASLDELLRTSDVVSVHLPLSEATRGTLGDREFGLMRDGAVLINTARGPIVDEAALVRALESGKLFAAGLDVFEREPEVHPALVANENVVLLPHIGTATVETQKAMELLVIENIRSAVEHGRLVTPVNEPVANGV